jgi:hypothetical protein
MTGSYTTLADLLIGPARCPGLRMGHDGLHHRRGLQGSNILNLRARLMSFVDIANWLTIVDGSDGAQQDISFTAPQAPPAGQPAGPAPKLRRVGSITARGGRRAARGGCRGPLERAYL